MANISGPQLDIKYCPICKGDLHNVPREKMKSRGHIRSDGTISEHTHTYHCLNCDKSFEINQHR
jgi:uncharacterized protein with PIN domain